MEEMRLQKYLAQCGAASRRKAEQLIKQGRVLLNGAIVTDMGIKVSENDRVELDGKKLFIEEQKVYILLNKPVGYVTTSKDQFARKTVLDLIQGIPQRIYPVGRLDYDTSGLLLLTNDGDFTFRLTHPKHEIKKVYIAKIEGVPDKNEIKDFETGLMIDGHKTSPAKLKILKKSTNSSIVRIVIHEGKNRQVRKMCEAIGHPVAELKRESIGSISLGDLKTGEWKYLSVDDVKRVLEECS